MPALLFQHIKADYATPIADDFILNHMPLANGNYVKVYLYVFHLFLRTSENASAGFSTKDTASALGMMESDIMQALQYWNEKHVLSLTQDGEQLWLSFPPYHSFVPTDPDPKGIGPDQTKVVRVEHKPTYSPEEIGIYEQNPIIKDLFTTASRLLGEQFSFPNLSLLFSFYDYYRLPVNVIKFLMEYCIQNGNRSLRYMEKVAQDWSDRGITTVEAAKSHIKRFDVYRPILKAFGITSRQPSEQEIEIMERWLYQYGLGLDLIVEAATRTLAKTGKPAFNYAESILKNWTDHQVRTLEDVSRLDDAFVSKQAAGSTAPSPLTPRQPKGTFHTYNTRDWDFDSIERRAQTQLYSQDRP